MIQIGFIGTGGIAETHAEAIQQVEGAKLAAVYDIDAQRAQAFAQKFDAAGCSSTEELLAFPGLEIVYILTPPPSHAELIAKAARAGLAIMCEKPITLSLREADEAIRIAHECKVPLMVGQSHRYHPLSALARQYIADGTLGDFVAAWSHRLINSEIRPGSWLSERSLSGGLVLQYALHDLDWERWIGGEVISASANEYRVDPHINIEDNLWSLVHFRNGGTGTVGVSWTCGDPYWERGVIGTRGNLRIIDQKKMVGKLADGTSLDKDLGDDYDWFDVFVRENRDVVEHLKAGKPMPVSGEEGRATLEMGLAVQRAAMTRQLVTLPYRE